MRVHKHPSRLLPPSRLYTGVFSALPLMSHKRHVDRRNRRHRHRPAPPVRPAIQVLPDVLDLEGSRPIRQGSTCSSRYAATASSRPFSVASPSPWMPSSVSIFKRHKIAVRRTDDHVSIRNLHSLLPGLSVECASSGLASFRARSRCNRAAQAPAIIGTPRNLQHIARLQRDRFRHRVRVEVLPFRSSLGSELHRLPLRNGLPVQPQGRKSKRRPESRSTAPQYRTFPLDLSSVVVSAHPRFTHQWPCRRRQSPTASHRREYTAQPHGFRLDAIRIMFPTRPFSSSIPDMRGTSRSPHRATRSHVPPDTRAAPEHLLVALVIDWPLQRLPLSDKLRRTRRTLVVRIVDVLHHCLARVQHACSRT